MKFIMKNTLFNKEKKEVTLGGRGIIAERNR